MSTQENRITRRKFLKGAGLVGLGTTVSLVAGRSLTNSTGVKSIRTGSTANPRPRSYSKVDTALIQYEEVGQIRPKFHALRGIAVSPDDRIYIVGDRSIGVFSEKTEPLPEIALNGRPQCVTITEDSTIYVGMKDRVEVYDGKGGHRASWDRLGPNAVLTSIAVSKDDVFVADAGNRTVLRYTTSGVAVRLIGKKEKKRNIPGFSVPSPYFDLAVAPDGLLRVANPGRHRVEAYTYDGDLELSWGKASMAIEGFCGCYNPINFALLPDGKFVTSEKGLPRIKIYNADGTFKGVVAAPEQFETNQKVCCSTGEVSATPIDISRCQAGGIDVAVDSQGRVLALDPVERVVRIFKPIESI